MLGVWLRLQGPAGGLSLIGQSPAFKCPRTCFSKERKLGSKVRGDLPTHKSCVPGLSDLCGPNLDTCGEFCLGEEERQ